MTKETIDIEKFDNTNMLIDTDESFYFKKGFI